MDGAGAVGLYRAKVDAYMEIVGIGRAVADGTYRCLFRQPAEAGQLIVQLGFLAGGPSAGCGLDHRADLMHTRA